MEKVFDHLRCPICGSELIYSEGTHDLCCTNNPYERMSRDHAAMEAASSYGPEEQAAGPHAGDEGYIYKVWGTGEPPRTPGTQERTRKLHPESVRTLFRSAGRKKIAAGTKDFPALIQRLRRWRTRKNRRHAYSR